MQFSWKVTFKSLKQDVTTKNGDVSQKQTVVVEEVNEQYPDSVPFEQFGKNSNVFDNVNEGDIVDVTYNCKSKERNGRNFAKISAWKVNKKVETKQENKEVDTGMPF